MHSAFPSPHDVVPRKRNIEGRQPFVASHEEQDNFVRRDTRQGACQVGVTCGACQPGANSRMSRTRPSGRESSARSMARFRSLL